MLSLSLIEANHHLSIEHFVHRIGVQFCVKNLRLGRFTPDRTNFSSCLTLEVSCYLEKWLHFWCLTAEFVVTRNALHADNRHAGCVVWCDHHAMTDRFTTTKSFETNFVFLDRENNNNRERKRVDRYLTCKRDQRITLIEITLPNNKH